MALKNTYKSILSASGFSILALGMLIATSGCSSIPYMQNQALPSASETSSSTGQYEVLMKPKFGKPVGFRGDIDGPLTVSAVLERSGATSKFRGMEITLLRVVKENGQPLRLPVEYSASDKTVTPAQDYSIHPNDQILVKAYSKSPLDKLAETVNL